MSTTVEVTFAAGSTRATVDVSIVDDTEIENSEMFTAVLSSSQSNVLIVDGTATVTILDNDGEKLFPKLAHTFILLLQDVLICQTFPMALWWRVGSQLMTQQPTLVMMGLSWSDLQ